MVKAQGDISSGKVLVMHTLDRQPAPFDTMWTDVREAHPRARVRLASGDTATVAVIQQEGSEPELHVLSGDVEIDLYDQEQYQDIKDEVAQ